MLNDLFAWADELKHQNKHTITNSDNASFIEANLPGLEQEDIRVCISGRLLTLFASKPESDFFYREQFNVGVALDTDGISVDYADGKLKITIPFAAKFGSRCVPINIKS